MNDSPLIVLAGGGTAGHVEPALATAEALLAQHPHWQVRFLGTTTGIESRLVPARGHQLDLIPRVPLPRRPSPALLALPWRLWSAARAADAIVKNAACVVGFGGYVSTPAYLAARLRGVPIVIHEQNARAGIANRLGARWAKATASTFAQSGLPDAIVIGLPLRREIAQMAALMVSDRAKAQLAARRALKLPEEGRLLLVTGGSQGSARINAAIDAALPELLSAGWTILHSVGESNPIPTSGERYFPVPYIHEMHLALAAADLMIGRAGAGTCAESAALALPAIFVPLPFGNGEQSLNARDSVAVGGAKVIPDAECDGPTLANAVSECASRLDQMRDALGSTAHLDAAERLVGLVQGAMRR